MAGSTITFSCTAEGQYPKLLVAVYKDRVNQFL